MTRARRRCTLVGTLALALAIHACDASPFAFEESAMGSLVATVVRGPTSPVEHEGAPSWEPVHGARISARPASGGLTRDAATDVNGLAHFRLPAGSWHVSVTTCPGAIGTPASQILDISPGSAAAARFECDTGIR